MSPPLILLWDVVRALENGYPIAAGVQNYLGRPPDDQLNEEFFYQIRTWWLSQQNVSAAFDVSTLSLNRRQLIKILEMGLNGESVLSHLKALETELVLSCEDEIQKFAALLPLKIMFPLLCLILPSMLILLIVPLLRLLQF
ncbi:MAG: hypothetical protein ACXWQQ_09835 [Pseudobdellovibrio sp.]